MLSLVPTVETIKERLYGHLSVRTAAGRFVLIIVLHCPKFSEISFELPLSLAVELNHIHTFSLPVLAGLLRTAEGWRLDTLLIT